MERPLPALSACILSAGLIGGPTLQAQVHFTVGNTGVDVEEMVTGLDVPWDLVLGPDGWIWFTQLRGDVSRLDPATGTVELIYTVPDVHVTALSGGLHSLAFHPDFAAHPYVYLHYVNSPTTSVVRRYRYDADLNTFTEVSDPLLSLHAGASHNGSRMVIDAEGMFLICLGEGMQSPLAQDMTRTNGKVLRFAPDGGIPADNPIPDSYVHTWGHRNPQGMVRAPNGIIYASEHGQANDDEINIIEPGRNYGWPDVAGLCNTPAEIAYCNTNDVREPIHEFTSEVVAPAGVDYFNAPSIPEWQHSLLVATLRGRALHQLKLNDAGDGVTEDNTYLSMTFGRLRDVLVHPDGRIFLCTSNHDYTGGSGEANDKILVLVGEGVSTGVQAPASPALRSYPNPAGDVLTIEGSGRWDLLLRDAAGRTVLHRTVMNTARIDVSALAPGVYQAQADDGRTRRTVPVVVQR